MAATLGEFTRWLEELIPPAFQEHYDNSGLQVGDPAALTDSVLLTVDVTAEVIAEASDHGCNLIISHHPLIFTPLKRIAGGSETERCVASAVRGASPSILLIQALITYHGVSVIYSPKDRADEDKSACSLKGKLSKLITFVPVSHAGRVREALFAAGAGHIGNYDHCSFSVTGDGTYRAGEGADPYAGQVGEDHSEPEIRLEVVMPSHLSPLCVRALHAAHPYEEVAYDIIALENEYHGAGAGAIGTLPVPLSVNELLVRLKELTGIPVIRYSGDTDRTITTVAVCGGSGSDLISTAARAGADAFVTGDIKYHAYIQAPGDISWPISDIMKVKIFFGAAPDR
jgi:putative NIF3 family GTP cyclohydrolase 1 type 2